MIQIFPITKFKYFASLETPEQYLFEWNLQL